MAHKEQKSFFKEIKRLFPAYFNDVKVIDCGSLDVNGSLRSYFDNSEYIGVDIRSGKNVDIVSPVHKLDYQDIDVIVSSEMLEHSEFYKQDLLKMYEMLKDNGLLVITAAGYGRRKHGVDEGFCSSDNYYKNILVKDFEDVFNAEQMFSYYQLKYDAKHKDIYFCGIKKDIQPYV